MNCNIIKDLLPSYIDEICSKDTVKMVEEHLQYCEKCKACFNSMQQEGAYVGQLPEEVAKAITPFKKINKKRRIQVIKAVVITFLTTFFITVVADSVYQNVGVVNQFFSPMDRGIVDVGSADEWERITFSDNNFLEKDHLIFDSIFWEKEITNHANNEQDVMIRVKDENGNIIVDEFQILHGTSVKLDSLKRNEKYFIEIKAPQGRFFINAT
ncbi:zf-HC2 domain-containing protein [Solibacillus sp. FSL H8-0538]|uniref:zf-HC2 domain-containing protein n=1 Tax=Solibacillus sp. FSL H8-0538 TaxID=2921400 RepID=UPI0030F4F83D